MRHEVRLKIGLVGTDRRLRAWDPFFSSQYYTDHWQYFELLPWVDGTWGGNIVDCWEFPGPVPVVRWPLPGGKGGPTGIASTSMPAGMTVDNITKGVKCMFNKYSERLKNVNSSNVFRGINVRPAGDSRLGGSLLIPNLSDAAIRWKSPYVLTLIPRFLDTRWTDGRQMVVNLSMGSSMLRIFRVWKFSELWISLGIPAPTWFDSLQTGSYSGSEF